MPPMHRLRDSPLENPSRLLNELIDRNKGRYCLGMRKKSIKHVELFSGQDLSLDYHDGGFPISIVTFEARNKYMDAVIPSAFEGGYGRGIFAQLGLNEFLVKRSRNHWYQSEEIEIIIDIIKERAKGTTLVTYGGSMGGMAAISFASKLGAEKFIALSPLYDISTDGEVPDDRWGDESHLFDFKYNFIRSGECREAQGYVFYCPDTIDVEHARCIERMTSGTLVPLEYGGHPVSFFLNDTYKLKRLVSEIAHGEFNLENFYRVVEANTELTHYPHEKRSAVHALAGDLMAAIADMRTAESMNPKLARLPFRLGELLIKSGQLEEAKLAFERAVSIAPSHAQAHARLSRIHEKQGNLSDAIRAIRRAVRYAPNNADVHRRLGELLIKADRYREAEVSLNSSIKHNGAHPATQVHLSYALAGQERWTEAITAMNQAIALAPLKPEYFLRLGEWQLAAKSLGDAELSINQAITLAPDRSQYRVRLSYVYAARKDYEQAALAMEQASRLAPERPEIFLRWGECLIKSGLLIEAERAMQEAVRLAPQQVRTQQRLEAVRMLITRRAAISSVTTR